MKTLIDNLKKYRYYLTLQEYKTIKGQIISGDVDGAIKGLNRIVKNRSIVEE